MVIMFVRSFYFNDRKYKREKRQHLSGSEFFLFK